MNNIYLMSDSHYGHKNIVRGESSWSDISRCRDFDTLDEHNEIIVDNINKTVGENDWLYHLGDWTFGGKENIYLFRRKIRCKNIILILGNHDHHIRKNTPVAHKTLVFEAQHFFHSVHDILERDWNGKKFVLCHYPIYSWHKENAGAIHIYGHTHDEVAYNRNAICVSLDCHPEFRPYELHELINIVNERTEENFPIKFGRHHESS